MLFRQICEKPVPLFSSYRFEISAPPPGLDSGKINLPEMEPEAQSRSHVSDEAGILPRLISPDAVMEMGDLETKAEPFFQSREEVKEGHGIRPAGNRHKDAIVL
jgi:hypothetical protein